MASGRELLVGREGGREFLVGRERERTLVG